MASFQILSDLHLEAPEAYDLFDIAPKAPYLALLGDIGNVKDTGLFIFLEAQLQKFQIVFYLLGNHEPYHSNWATARENMQKFSTTINQKRTQEGQQLGEFVFMDQARYDISPHITVLGCILYSRVPKSQETHVSFGLNDFYHIENWTVEAHCAAHEADRTWLNDQVSQIVKSEPRRKIVIFSHHSPTLAAAAVDPVHANSPISSVFATDIAEEPCWKNTQVCLWAFGHTHYNCDFIDDKTGKRLVANQRGYYFAQSKAFDPEKVVGVEQME